MRMLHLGLRVTDLQRSLAFYTAVGYTTIGTVPEVRRAPGEPPFEQADERREVPGPAAEERHRRAPVGHQRVRGGVRRLAGDRVALVRRLAVAVHGVVAAALQFVADRRLAGAGDALDQIVPDAHQRAVTASPRCRHGSPPEGTERAGRPACGAGRASAMLGAWSTCPECRGRRWTP
ncbi:VOC family protein [Spirilliplanes yamanashiensis]|uniref:VOC domain-containing protein n=1 Tax=Spirilliplanes yamanashiensis TaxID=42233 RepID=A0A8J3YBE3_9ACTN|nr:VOC family protein [Spirilliplanes yamanashiensis]MDP9817818.1 catechol 2,3-dioxygenase-like lactoylglutathione lyase family enzyme [Spirilliplanes yamanashiensis]GIJ04628.1 hypothetical protein Sya03_39800 [Spirilliplanes yamanashiensis]